MSQPGDQLIDELRAANARLDGQLEAVSAQLAAMTANESQLRVELEAALAQAAAAEAAAAHTQQLARAREEAAAHRIADLEEQLAEARRLQAQAEEERAAVIAALGRRARKRLTADERTT